MSYIGGLRIAKQLISFCGAGLDPLWLCPVNFRNVDVVNVDGNIHSSWNIEPSLNYIFIHSWPSTTCIMNSIQTQEIPTTALIPLFQFIGGENCKVN
jgi:hypothetical protein